MSKPIYLLFFVIITYSKIYGQSIPPITRPGTIGSNNTKARILYSYDAAGNRIKRELTIVNITPQRPVQDSLSDTIADNSSASEAFSKSKNSFELNVYPNPTHSTVVIEIITLDPNNRLEYVFELLDLNGRVIRQQKSRGEKLEFNLESLPVAEYFIVERKNQLLYKIIKN